MKTYKIDGDKIQFPDGWHDVPYDKALKIIEGTLSDVEVFSLLTGMDKDRLLRLEKPKDVEIFMYGFPFLYGLPINDHPQIPITFKYGDQRYSLPHVLFNDPYDFGNCQVGQIEDMKAIIRKKIKEYVGDEEREMTNMEQIKLMRYVVAIFVQKIMDKEYSYDKSMKIADELGSNMSFKDVVSMGNFFLRKLIGLKSGSSMVWLHRLWIVKKLRRVQKRLINYLDSMLP